MRSPWLPVVGEEKGAEAASTFQFERPGGCGCVHFVSSKPAPTNCEWPKIWCGRCMKKLRTSK
eukprot:9087782-Alexandrium_andersonii.AAC.1